MSTIQHPWPLFSPVIHAPNPTLLGILFRRINVQRLPGLAEVQLQPACQNHESGGLFPEHWSLEARRPALLAQQQFRSVSAQDLLAFFHQKPSNGSSLYISMPLL